MSEWFCTTSKIYDFISLALLISYKVLLCTSHYFIVICSTLLRRVESHVYLCRRLPFAAEIYFGIAFSPHATQFVPGFNVVACAVFSISYLFAGLRGV